MTTGPGTGRRQAIADLGSLTTVLDRSDAAIAPGRFDHAEPRQAQRRGRERGCWVYISGEQLQRCGVNPRGDAPRYRVWAAQDRPRVVVNLYPVLP